MSSSDRRSTRGRGFVVLDVGDRNSSTVAPTIDATKILRSPEGEIFVDCGAQRIVGALDASKASSSLELQDLVLDLKRQFGLTFRIVTGILPRGVSIARRGTLSFDARAARGPTVAPMSIIVRVTNGYGKSASLRFAISLVRSQGPSSQSGQSQSGQSQSGQSQSGQSQSQINVHPLYAVLPMADRVACTARPEHRMLAGAPPRDDAPGPEVLEEGWVSPTSGLGASVLDVTWDGTKVARKDDDGRFDGYVESETGARLEYAWSVLDGLPAPHRRLEFPEPIALSGYRLQGSWVHGIDNRPARVLVYGQVEEENRVLLDDALFTHDDFSVLTHSVPAPGQSHLSSCYAVARTFSCGARFRRFFFVISEALDWRHTIVRSLFVR